jgi:hypothetical protein
MAKFSLFLALVLFTFFDKTDANSGLDTVLLEDGPDRPLNAEGQPVVPAEEPQEWWWDGGIVAPPYFSVNGGIYPERVEVRIYSATLDAMIYFHVGQKAEDIPDPTEINGILYNSSEPIVLVRSGYIKAAAFHPYALDSMVVTSKRIFIQVKQQCITGYTKQSVRASCASPTASEQSSSRVFAS